MVKGFQLSHENTSQTHTTTFYRFVMLSKYLFVQQPNHSVPPRNRDMYQISNQKESGGVVETEVNVNVTSWQSSDRGRVWTVYARLDGWVGGDVGWSRLHHWLTGKTSSDNITQTSRVTRPGVSSWTRTCSWLLVVTLYSTLRWPCQCRAV